MFYFFGFSKSRFFVLNEGKGKLERLKNLESPKNGGKIGKTPGAEKRGFYRAPPRKKRSKKRVGTPGEKRGLGK